MLTVSQLFRECLCPFLGYLIGLLLGPYSIGLLLGPMLYWQSVNCLGDIWVHFLDVIFFDNTSLTLSPRESLPWEIKWADECTHADAWGSAEVASTAVSVQTGGSSNFLLVIRKCLLRAPGQWEPSLLQTRLLLWLDNPPIDGVNIIFLPSIISIRFFSSLRFFPHDEWCGRSCQEYCPLQNS